MICVRCLRHGEFYASRKRVCKECVKLAARQSRAANLEKVRAYDRERARTNPERRAHILRQLKKLAVTKPAARRAHVIVGNAIRDRRLIKKPCEVCGSKNVIAHHDDYLKPLEVRWLCHPHHCQWHIANGPGANFDAPLEKSA